MTRSTPGKDPGEGHGNCIMKPSKEEKLWHLPSPKIVLQVQQQYELGDMHGLKEG